LFGGIFRYNNILIIGVLIETNAFYGYLLQKEDRNFNRNHYYIRYTPGNNPVEISHCPISAG